jgi:hypothetical protein
MTVISRGFRLPRLAKPAPASIATIDQSLLKRVGTVLLTLSDITPAA